MIEKRQIRDTEYFIDKDGNVYSKRGHIMSTWIEGNTGYTLVRIRKDNKPVTYRLHRILAEAWLDNPDNLPFVKHKNDNKSDNSVDNLAWGANPDNVKEGYDNGCYKFFTRSYKIKAVRKTDKIEFTFDSIRSAALALSMDRKAISAILKNLKNNNSLFEFYYI